MSDQDIPNLDESTSRLPEDIRSDLAERGKSDLFFFGKGVLGYKDMNESAHGALCVYINHNPQRI